MPVFSRIHSGVTSRSGAQFVVGLYARGQVVPQADDADARCFKGGCHASTALCCADMKSRRDALVSRIVSQLATGPWPGRRRCRPAGCPIAPGCWFSAGHGSPRQSGQAHAACIDGVARKTISVNTDDGSAVCPGQGR